MPQESTNLRLQLEYRKRLMDKINEIHSADNLNTILIHIKDSIAERHDNTQTGRDFECLTDLREVRRVCIK